jgi:itaconate CoA-transferase
VTGLPLEDVHVVAVEQAVAAPLCTRHLADLGARVTKVERPPNGDFARAYDTVSAGQSAYFVWLNRAKESVVLDLASDRGRAALARLLDDADVLVHNLGPGVLDRLGFGEDVLGTRWPALIRCGISGYGPDGPYRDRKGFDLLLQAESGLMATTGSPEEPAKVGISIADISAGMYALSAILAALRLRDRRGEGARIEISMLDCLAEWMTVPMAWAAADPAAPARVGMRHATIVPYGPFRASDGVVCLAVQNAAQWERLCRQVLGRPDLIDDPAYATNEARVRARDRLEPVIEAITSSLTQAEVEARLTAADVPFGAVNAVADVLRHPQLEARDRWFLADTPTGPVRAVKPPFGIAGMPLRAGAVPALGEAAT